MRALWLAVGLGLYSFSGGKAQAQVAVVDGQADIGLYSQAQVGCGGLGIPTDYKELHMLITNALTTNLTSYTNQPANGGDCSGSSRGSVSITASNAPLQFYFSGSVNGNGSGSPEAGVGGGGQMIYRLGFTVAQRLRFNIKASASLTADGNNSAGKGDGVQGDFGVNLNDNGFSISTFSIYKSDTTSGFNVVTNLSGIVVPGDAYQAEFSLSADANGIGTLSVNGSCDVQMTFDPLPVNNNEILGEFLSGGAMRFTYVGLAGTNYVLDRTFNLAPPIHWVPQLTNPAYPSGLLILTNTPVPTTNNFWRIRFAP